MKKLLLVIAFLAVSASRCYAGDGAIPIMQVAVSSVTTTVVAVSTSVATQVDNPQLTNRRAMEIQNIDASANLWCLPVTTTPAANSGRKIAAGSSWIIAVANSVGSTGVSPVAAKFWCLSDGAASTKAAVTQLY